MNNRDRSNNSNPATPQSGGDLEKFEAIGGLLKPTVEASNVPRTLVSLIIPTRNNARTLPALLRSIENQVYKLRETIIVDNGSVDSTVRIADQFQCTVLQGGPERSAQRNLGADKSSGELLFFVDSDMELTMGVLEECVHEIARADALCVREITVGRGYWSRVRSFERDRYFKSNIFEAARCFRRNIFENLGGYDTHLTGLEDYDLHARFCEKGLPLGWVERPIIHHEEGLSLNSYIQKRARYSRTDSIYASRFPSRWREQKSFSTRIRKLTSKPIRVDDLPLLPGLAFMRSIEWALRAQK